MFEWLKTKVLRSREPLASRLIKAEYPFNTSENSIHLEVFQSADLDWFASDKYGRIGWFTSGFWGHVPKSVADELPHLDHLMDYFVEGPLLGERGPAEIADHLNLPGPISSWDRYGQYVEGVVRMAKKGLFCFDVMKVTGNDYQTRGYDRIAVPASALTLADVVPEIAAVLVRIRLDCSFQECEQLGLSIGPQ